MKATWQKRILQFKLPAGTSRGILTNHTVYYLILWHESNEATKGIGEAAPLPGLSLDFRPDFEAYLTDFCLKPNINDTKWDDFPSIRFAYETALLDLCHGGQKKIFDTPFFNEAQPIAINGLVWMADKENMLRQVKAKIDEGYHTIKLKIGNLDFEAEVSMIQHIRTEYNQIEIRLDANGAFAPQDALEKLKRLSDFNIHSVEQPIKPNQVESMTFICKHSPIDIALDEELILKPLLIDLKIDLLKKIAPAYIILKPTLVGGFAATKEWISAAESLGISWWLTSALESNIGLNAIAQFTSLYHTTIPQGLGTGNLYENNVFSPLTVEKGFLNYQKDVLWEAI
jgi:o-succinylbenzoate synthase